MNLICPNCGQAGGKQDFQWIGQKKLLCIHCKAVLKLALQCPVCGGIVQLPFISTLAKGQMKKLINKIIFSKTEYDKLKCPVCDNITEKEKFDRVVIFEEEFSVIIN